MDDSQNCILWVVIILNPLLITGKPRPPENIQISVTRNTTIITWNVKDTKVDRVRLFVLDSNRKELVLWSGRKYFDFQLQQTSYEINTTSLTPCTVYTVKAESYINNGSFGVFSESVERKFWLVAQNVTADLNTNATLTWKTIYKTGFNVEAPSKAKIFTVDPGGGVINNFNFKYTYSTPPGNLQDIDITVMNVNDTDGGIYKSVSSQIDASSIYECCLLIISGEPTKPVLTQHNQSPFVGDDINLTCKSDVRRWPAGVSSSLTFQFFGHRRIQQYGGKLTINKATKSDIGVNISCQAVDDLGKKSEQSDNITLNIFSGPDDVVLSPSLESVTTTEGSTVGPIQCSAICNPKCEIRWKKITANKRSTNGTLCVSPVGKEDGGTYQCTAINPQNRLKRLNRNVTVAVLFPPSITDTVVRVKGHEQKTSTNYSFTEGDNVHITLTIDSNPAVNLTLNSSRVPSIYLQCNKSGLRYTFQLPASQCEHSGIFLIEADNGIKENAIWNNTFDIRCQPKRVKLFSDKIGTKLGAKETVSVLFVANPEPRIEWYKQSSNFAKWNLKKNKDTFSYNATSTVTIKNEHDMGTYTIRIENLIGWKIRNVTFIPRGNPEQPTNFSYENVTFRQATLLWTAGFNGGGTQTFTIFYKNEYDDNFKGPIEVEATDTRKGTKIYHNLLELLSQTSYNVVLVASNEYGNINTSLQFTTEAEPVLTSPLSTQRPIFIGAAAGVALLVLPIVIFFIAKKKNGRNGTRSTNVRTDKNTKRKSKEELADNDIIPGQSNAEYACVNKPAQKGLQKKEYGGNSNSEYACVKKSKLSGSQKEDAQENTEYAVVDKTHKNTVFDEENQYANRLDDSSPIINLESKSPGRRVNDDGLVYMEVAFPNNKSDRKPIIIHGDENRTNYVDIDFTKKAEPLSESGND